MAWRQNFYWRWLYRTFTPAWKAQNYTVGVLRFLIPLVLIPLAQKYLSSWGRQVTDLAWQVPLAVLIGFLVIQFFLVPYQMDREREQVEVEIKDENNKLRAQLTANGPS